MSLGTRLAWEVAGEQRRFEMSIPRNSCKPHSLSSMSNAGSEFPIDLVHSSFAVRRAYDTVRSGKSCGSPMVAF
jgi:hypothetical protein